MFNCAHFYGNIFAPFRLRDADMESQEARVDSAAKAIFVRVSFCKMYRGRSRA
jgi:hypothetical protein